MLSLTYCCTCVVLHLKEDDWMHVACMINPYQWVDPAAAVDRCYSPGCQRCQPSRRLSGLMTTPVRLLVIGVCWLFTVKVLYWWAVLQNQYLSSASRGPPMIHLSDGLSRHRVPSIDSHFNVEYWSRPLSAWLRSSPKQLAVTVVSSHLLLQAECPRPSGVLCNVKRYHCQIEQRPTGRLGSRIQTTS